MIKRIALNRREVLILASVAMVGGPVIGSTEEPANDVHVVKDPGCGCCTGWIEILKNAGFNVTGEDRTGRFLTAFKTENNVPEVMMSCHTAKVGGCFIGGHVPVRDIKRLLRDPS